jgi:hypothetical protein
MRKKIIFAVLGILFLLPLASEAGTIEEFCRTNAKAMHKSVASCVKAEQAARDWLAVNPVPDDIYLSCKTGAGESRSLLKDCVVKETYTRNARLASPLALVNSRVWYTPLMRSLFLSNVRVCGYGHPLDGFAVLPLDITKFHFTTSLNYSESLPFMNLKGSVDIAPLPKDNGLKPGNNKYDLYIDAFLVSGDGKVVDIRSTTAPSPLSKHGGTVGFSLEIGHGYYFDRGGTILVLASASPIKTQYPGSDCLVIGAKKLTFGK